MNKKLLKEAVDASFNEGNLVEEMVLAIAKRLKRSELKQYLNGLKKKFREITIFVQSPFALTNQQISEIQTVFPGKDIILTRKSSLLLGLQIIHNDMIYDFTLKNKLELLTNYLKK